ncbi:MAG: hypothetical protein ACJ8FY_13740 [Gemmataceae bacterium]
MASLLDLIRADIKPGNPARSYEINGLNEISPPPPEARPERAAKQEFKTSQGVQISGTANKVVKAGSQLSDDEWICRAIEKDQGLPTGSLELWNVQAGKVST